MIHLSAGKRQARFMAVSALSLLVLAAGGCVYQFGSSLPSNLKTVYVPTFVNKCGEPQVETRATQAAIQEFQKDGTLRVVESPDQADLVVTVTVTSYKIEPLRYARDQPQTATEYRLRIGASIVVTKHQTPEVFMKRDVEGENSFLVIGDMTSSKQAALPNAALDLAHKIVQSIVEYW